MKSKIAILILLLVATAVILHVRGAKDPTVASEPLQELPLKIGGFEGHDVALDPEVLQVLGDGRFLSRTYRRAGQLADAPPMDLLIAYYPTQRSGQSIHSPQNCLPGAGWTFERSGVLDFTDRMQRPHRVAEYLVANGPTKMEVLYWYRSRGHDIANDYAAKGYLMVQAVRDGRTDGGLIRIMTAVGSNETQAQARMRAIAFAASLEPLLPPFLPG